MTQSRRLSRRARSHDGASVLTAPGCPRLDDPKTGRRRTGGRTEDLEPERCRARGRLTGPQSAHVGAADAPVIDVGPGRLLCLHRALPDRPRSLSWVPRRTTAAALARHRLRTSWPPPPTLGGPDAVQPPNRQGEVFRELVGRADRAADQSRVGDTVHILQLAATGGAKRLAAQGRPISRGRHFQARVPAGCTGRSHRGWLLKILSVVERAPAVAKRRPEVPPFGEGKRCSGPDGRPRQSSWTGSGHRPMRTSTQDPPSGAIRPLDAGVRWFRLPPPATGTVGAGAARCVSVRVMQPGLP